MNALLMSGGINSVSIAWWKRPDLARFLSTTARSAAQRGARCWSRCLRRDGHCPQNNPGDCSSLGSGDMAGIYSEPHMLPFRSGGRFGTSLF